MLLDRRLPDSNAEELLPRLRQLAPNTAVLIVTGYADLQGAIAALRQGAADYILKPINPDALRASLARLAERRRLTLAHERSETAFRALIEAAPCLIVILRADYTIAYFSPFAEEVTGYRASEVVGGNYIESFLCGDCRSMVREHLQQVFAGTPVRGFENPVRCRDGSHRWFIWNAQRLADYEGAPAVLKVGQDITALKQAQERTLQAERLAAIGQMMAGLAHESSNAFSSRFSRPRPRARVSAWRLLNTSSQRTAARLLLERLPIEGRKINFLCHEETYDASFTHRRRRRRTRHARLFPQSPAPVGPYRSRRGRERRAISQFLPLLPARSGHHRHQDAGAGWH